MLLERSWGFLVVVEGGGIIIIIRPEERGCGIALITQIIIPKITPMHQKTIRNKKFKKFSLRFFVLKLLALHMIYENAKVKNWYS